MHMYIFCKNGVIYLDAIIYNKITSIVNVIRLKLFTLISIVYKYGTIFNVDLNWKRHGYTEGILME